MTADKHYLSHEVLLVVLCPYWDSHHSHHLSKDLELFGDDFYTQTEVAAYYGVTVTPEVQASLESRHGLRDVGDIINECESSSPGGGL